ncbi:hypothetical protein ACHAXS_012798 [Conticribra weissflogii]
MLPNEQNNKSNGDKPHNNIAVTKTADPTAKASPAAKRIVNPYARKRPATTPPVVRAPNDSAGVLSKPDAAPHRKRRSYEPPPVGPTTTFSQAFGDFTHPDAHYGEDDLAGQRAFDEELAASHASDSSNPATTTTTTPPINPRDYHSTLQPHILHISTRQRGNPLLSHIRNVPHQFSPMTPDYIFSPTRCALFLSLRYHNLHPNYIHRRIAELKSDFELRVLLCLVDVDDNSSALLFLNDLCVQNHLTLILSWSEEEAARYLETLKQFDGKDASAIQKREHVHYIDRVAHVLGSVRSVNKTDAVQLMSQFGTFRNLAGAEIEELSLCPGVGVKKVKRLLEAFRAPFSREGRKKKRRLLNDDRGETGDGDRDGDGNGESKGETAQIHTTIRSVS